MRILIAGGSGQVAKELLDTRPPNSLVKALDKNDMDITNENEIRIAVEKFKPNLVINAAAYTNVDKAEFNSEEAFLINGQGAENLAKAAIEMDARFIHISTDYVFNGEQSIPYKPSDDPDPINVYGKSKLDGEKRVLSVSNDNAIIVRTSWVYSKYGNNFVKVMLELFKSRETVNVVEDQIGTPTWATSLAKVIWSAAENYEAKGVLHFTDAGVASWYDFAVAIQEESIKLGLQTKKIRVMPISSNMFPVKAKRPSYSVLEKSDTRALLGVEIVNWRLRLREMLQDMVL